VLSRNLEKSLHRALACANERRHEYATLEHLLLSLTEDQDAVAVLRDCGVDIERLRHEALSYVDDELAHLVAAHGGDAKPTASFQRVLQRAAIHVQSTGCEAVTGANVLVAMFAEAKSRAVFLLQEQGMTRFDAVNFISHSVTEVPRYAARVLVVDDVEANAKLLAAKLSSEYFDVLLAENGRDALQIADAEQPDIILLDVMMPRNGFEICRRLKANPRTADIPVIMVTALTDVDSHLRGLEVGADDILTKPVCDIVLFARVRSLLRLKRAREELRTQIRRKRLQDRFQENYQRSLSLALTDELTRLYNRRYLLAHLDELIDRVNNDHINAAILLFDIDHFKRVSDTYGHAAGDDVLCELATRAMNSVRRVDLVARLGGEEFVVVMPETDITIATVVAEWLRLAVAREPFIIGTDSMKVAVTISIGATVAASGDGRDELLKRADEALCSAKNGGRSRVVVRAPLRAGNRARRQPHGARALRR